MKKCKNICLILMLAFTLCACGADKSATGQQVTNIHVQKDGKIEQTIYENFQETYYHVEELADFASRYIDDFNQENADKHIELKSCKMDEKSNGMIKVVMEYDSCDTYAMFNQVEMFEGTIEEAYESGYDLNLYLNRVNSKKEESIVKEDLLKMGDKHILITDQNIMIHCYDEIMYGTDQVKVIGKDTVVMEQEQGTSAIVFK